MIFSLSEMEQEFTTKTEDVNQLEHEIIEFEESTLALQQSHE